MGCDGGTIPRRDELVRVQKKPEQKDKNAERLFLWRNCALSQQLLQPPIVACGLGRLYSKSSILEALLDKPNKPPSISHVKSLKDIKDLKLTQNPAYTDGESADSSVIDTAAPYICPVIGLEMTGKFRFVFLWSCGCVFSERALKEIRQNICHQCQTPFGDNDVVVLNGTSEDLDSLKEKIATRNANRKSSKKVKNETVTAQSAEVPSTSAEVSSTYADNVIQTEKEQNIKKEVDTNCEPGPSNATVKKEELDPIPLTFTMKNAKYPTPRGHLGPSKRAPGTELVSDPSYKKTKKDYSVASDPKSSEVYKSIFTTHQSEKDQNRAHWVTYNPFYN